MNCKEAQILIAQFAEARPAADLLAHARSCEGCRHALEELIQHQTWLRRQFAEVSARLLSEAPVVTEVMLQERLQRLPPPPSRARPLFWAVGLAVVVAVAGVTVWQVKYRRSAGTSTAASQQKSTSAGAKKSATNIIARATQKLSAMSGRTAAAKPKSKQKPKAEGQQKPDEFDLDAPDMALKSGMPPSDVAGAKPAGANEAEQPGKQMPATGPQTLALVASAAIPTASGNIVAAGHVGADGTPAPATTMNLHGLAAQSAYVVTGLDANGQRIVLANFMTDASGSASTDLAAALSHGPPQAAGTDATPWLRQLVVLDSAGNTILTVSSTPETPAQTPTEPPP